jgi:hypothetical protein
MSCVDRLLSSIVASIDGDTAVLVTGDHGTATGSQVGAPPDSWSDADIAERFGVLMAYHLPSGCDEPALADPITVMAEIASCAVGTDFEVAPPVSLIGDTDPQAVDAGRMERIQAQVAAGTLPPEAS